jgi:flagellar protein FliS
MDFNSSSNVYQQVEINTSNQLQLVVMLYDGALRFNHQAKTAIKNRDLIRKAQSMDRLLAIIGELQNTLKTDEGGEIAFQLDRLYSYMIERILEASAELDCRPLEEVHKLLNILNSAWTEIARKNDKAAEAAAGTAVANPLAAKVGSGVESRLNMELYG